MRLIAIASLSVLACVAGCQRDAAKPPAAAAVDASVAAKPPTGDAGADPRIIYARASAQRFATALREALTGALGSGGPKAAVAVCNEKAPAIAAGIALESGWSIRRTSLKLRNVGNAPDAWERSVLEQFTAQRARGADPTTLEHYEIVREDGREVFRYMKAIPTAEMCLSCHGPAIESELAAELSRLYPNDQARGFQVGDIRGAFSLRKNQ